MLDVFKQDAFSLVSLTAAVQKVPYKPGRIGQLGLFRERGISTTTVVVEEQTGQLTLIATSPRGGPGSVIGGGDKRKARSFLVPHLQREATVMADEVQGVRAFGTENTTQSVEMVVNDRLATLRAMHEATLEYHRIGAIKGQILDSNGSSVIYNLFTEFGLSQQTYEIDLSEEVREQCVAIQRLVENELGAVPVSGYRALCGDSFFDDLIQATSVKESLKYQESQVLRTDLRKGFEYAGITWENYRGKVGNLDFIPTAEAYVVPEGTDIFQTNFAPADYIETVNTLGLPLYAKILPDPTGANKCVKVDTQSNPLCLCLRPRAVIKLTLTT
jgi:hypothetical protein